MIRRPIFLAWQSVAHFPSMAKWLQSVIDDGFWDLHLRLSAPECGDWSLAGYWWGHERIVCAIVGLPPRAPSNLPTTLLQYYSLVDGVNWSVFGAAGGFDGASGHSPLAENFPHYAEEKPDADKLRVWGTSCGGDLLIYSLDNQGGWLCHETGEIHWLGTIADTINWVFREMLENRGPDFNYDWLRKNE